MSEFQVGRTIDGVYLLSGLSFSLTKNGSDMFQCKVFSESQESISAVCFDVTVVKSLKELGVSTIGARIVAVCQEYNGKVNLKITFVTDLFTEGLEKFLPSLDSKQLVSEITPMIKEGLSKQGISVISSILSEYSKDLKYAQASENGGYHDGLRGGLLNHIRKLFRYGLIVMDEYRDVFSENERDLFFIGLFVHDLGKLIELENGTYSKYSIVPHTYWGIELLSKLKDKIVETYGEMFYVELQAIILEHHGEFGERPKTIYAYLVHCVDLLDSRVSGLKQVIGTGDVDTLKFDDFYLKYNRY